MHILAVYIIYMDEAVSLMLYPHLENQGIPFGPSGMGGPTGNQCYRQRGTQGRLHTQASLLGQIRDTNGGKPRPVFLCVKFALFLD
jgi:hypothetical protein